MLNPVKLFFLTTGAVVVLAVTPYLASRAVPGSNQSFGTDAAATRIDSSDTMAELPTPQPGAPVEAMKSKLTDSPTRKDDRKASAKEEELPRPGSAKSKTETAAAKSETKTSEKKAVPTATPKVELPFRAEVQRAQEMLTKMGQFSGKTDGKLGPITQAAITSFQKKSGVTVKGEPTAETLKKMESAVAELTAKEEKKEVATSAENKSDEVKPAAEKKTESSKADDPQFVVLRKTDASSKPTDIGPVPRMTRVAEVKQLQEMLRKAKSYSGDVDGKWGHLTIVAMKEFQENNGLNVTGKPNKETWQKLNDIASGNWEVVEKPATEQAKSSVEKPTKADSAIVITDATPSPKKKDANKAPLTITVTEAALREQKKEAEDKKAAVTEKSPSKSTTDELPVSQPATEEVETVKASTPSPSTAPAAQTEAVAAPLEEPASLSAEPVATPSGDVVVKLNADAGASDNQPLGTPAAVSASATVDQPELQDPTQPILLPVEPAVAGPAVSSTATPVQASTAEEPSIVVRAPKREGAAEPPAVESSSKPATPPASSEPIATPGQASVTSPEPKQEQASATTTETPATTPVAAAVKTEETDLPPAASKAAAAKLEKDLAEVQARIAMVSSDPRYELDKFAPKSLETVNSLVTKVKSGASAAMPDASSTRADLRKIDEELEKAKQECIKQKADQKVAQVDAIYKEVKDRFGSQITKASKSKDDSAAKLADLMAKIDTGYTAMKADYKKGNYDPIVERCDGFKLQIEILGNEAARDYLETELEKSRRKLSKETLAEIEDLRGKNKYLEAANVLDSAAKSKSSSSSKRKS